jgi:hypothetical protein
MVFVSIIGETGRPGEVSLLNDGEFVFLELNVGGEGRRDGSSAQINNVSGVRHVLGIGTSHGIEFAEISHL